MNTVTSSISYASHLSCSVCGKEYSIDQLQHVSPCCSKPLFVEYARILPLRKHEFGERKTTMWRYAEMLPLFDMKNMVSLGEGMTPILRLKMFIASHGLENLYLKDEGLNPTGSFKARGMSMAISKAKELGVKRCVVPTAGNAGGAMAAYCTEAGIDATVIMPSHTPKIFQDECRIYGAEVKMVDGLIDKCGQVANDIAKATGAFNLATLREPYRLEGKKTMGFEIAEQMDWQLPDVILYPTGGGTGLIGIWKAFHEMISMGWIDGDRLPKMVAIQSENCSPVVDYLSGKSITENSYQESIAGGLAVPKVFGLEMISQLIKESNGFGKTVSEIQIIAAMNEFTKATGISVSPEGAAPWAALKDLLDEGKILKEEKILLLNTGNGYKHLA